MLMRVMKAPIEDLACEKSFMMTKESFFQRRHLS